MKRSLATLAVVLVVLGGCSSKKTNTPSSPTANPGGNGATITMEDFKFVPAQLSASASKPLVLINKGAALHNFSIEGSNLSVDVQPGQTQSLPPPSPVQPGTYTFFCKYHRAQGMTGTITVTA